MKKIYHLHAVVYTRCGTFRGRLSQVSCDTIEAVQQARDEIQPKWHHLDYVVLFGEDNTSADGKSETLLTGDAVKNSVVYFTIKEDYE